VADAPIPDYNPATTLESVASNSTAITQEL